MQRIGLWSIVIVLSVGCCQAEIPSYIHVCKATEPDVSKCILNSVNLLKPQLMKGIPELGVPPLEPLPLDVIKIRRGPTSTRISANITDLQVWGPSDFEILDLRADLNKNKFLFKVKLPYLHFRGKYDLDMQILLLRLTGKGPIIGNLSNYGFEAVMKGNVIQKDGNDYQHFEDMNIRIHVGEAKLSLENLFSHDALLGKISREVVSENTDLFMNEIRPNLESSLADKFLEIANKITLGFTYQELFPGR